MQTDERCNHEPGALITGPVPLGGAGSPRAGPGGQVEPREQSLPLLNAKQRLQGEDRHAAAPAAEDPDALTKAAGQRVGAEGTGGVREVQVAWREQAWALTPSLWLFNGLCGSRGFTMRKVFFKIEDGIERKGKHSNFGEDWARPARWSLGVLAVEFGLFPRALRSHYRVLK